MVTVFPGMLTMLCLLALVWSVGAYSGSYLGSASLRNARHKSLKVKIGITRWVSIGAAVSMNSNMGVDPLEELMGFGKVVPDMKQDVPQEPLPTNAAEINKLVEERVIARYNGDYEVADRVKERLFTEYGVTIHDSRGIWESSDGQRGHIKGRPRSYQDQAAPVLPVPCALTAEYIQQQVEKRTDLRRQWRYQEADGIRDELAAAGVELFDPSNEWASYDGRLSGAQSTDRDDYVT